MLYKETKKTKPQLNTGNVVSWKAKEEGIIKKKGWLDLLSVA